MPVPPDRIYRGHVPVQKSAWFLAAEETWHSVPVASVQGHRTGCLIVVTSRQHQPWQEPWSASSTGCTDLWILKEGSCHVIALQEYIILKHVWLALRCLISIDSGQIKLLSFPYFWNIIHRRGRNFCCTLASCKCVSQIWVIRGIQVKNCEWCYLICPSWGAYCSCVLIVFFCKEEKKNVWGSNAPTFYPFILTLFFVFIDSFLVWVVLTEAGNLIKRRRFTNIYITILKCYLSLLKLEELLHRIS